MKTIRFSMFLWLFAISSYGASLSKVQREQISFCINAYKSNLEQYCNAKDESQRSNLRSNLLFLFKDPNINPHVKDYDELDEDGRQIQSFTDYIKNIELKYSFKVFMEFTKGEVIDCIDVAGGKSGIYSMEKKITVNGVPKTFSEIIVVNLPENENDNAAYRISEVMSAASYRGASSGCGKFILVTEDQLDLSFKQKEADRLYFEIKDYLNARKFYEYILRKRPDDNYILAKVKSCKDALTRTDYLEKANFHLTKKEYSEVVTWYKKLLNEYPKVDEQIILDKIHIIEQAAIDANFNNYMLKGDVALEQGAYSTARYYFEQAIVIKASDKTALSSLDRAKTQDDKYAEEEIKRVVSLASQSSKYFGEYIKVLIKYEGYGNHIHLSGKQYYNMVILFNNYDSNVMKEMNFSRKDCRDYCKIYCKKLNDSYYKETDGIVKEDIRHLLTNVINNRNQN